MTLWTCNCAQCNGTLEAPEAPDCPETCASMRRCPDGCGGCSCHLAPPCTHCMTHEAGECDCLTKAEIRADRAEARADAARDDR